MQHEVMEVPVTDTGVRSKLKKEDIMHNMKVLVLLDAIFFTGAADLGVVVGPLYVWLGMSNTFIGILSGATFAGLLGVFISPWISRRFPVKKYYMLVAHVPYLLTWLLSGLALIFADRLGFDRNDLMWMIFGLGLANAFLGGFVTLPHQEYVAACIPMSYRGRYTGYSFTVGGILSVGSAALGGYILKVVEKPFAFGWLYVFCWAFCQGGYLLGLFGREERTPVEKSPHAWSKEMFKAFWNDKPFIRLLVVFTLYNLCVGPMFPFYSIYGFKELKMAAAASAALAIVGTIVRSLTSTPAGLIVDKLGPRRVYAFSPLLAIPAALVMLFVKDGFGIHGLGVYIGAGLTALYMAATYSAFTALAYGLPKPEHRSGHFTFQILVTYAAASIGPIFVGWMLDNLLPMKTVLLGHQLSNYTLLFAIQIVLCIIATPIAWYLLKGLSDKHEDYA